VSSEQTVASKVTRGGAARAISYIAGSLVSAIASIFLLRHLGLVEFGRYGTVMALLTIVQGITEGGLTTTATRDMALLDPRERRGLLRDLVALRIVLSLVGVALAVGFALVAGYEPVMVTGAFVAGIGVVLVSVQAAYLVPLAVELRNGRVAVNEVVRQTVLMLGIIGLALAGGGLASFFTNQAVAGLVLLAASPLIVGRAHIALPRWNPERARKLLREAAPLALVTALGTIYFRVLVIVTSLLATDDETAQFVTSNRVFEMLIGLPLLLTGVTLPVVSLAARDDPGRLRYVTQRLVEVAFLLGAGIGLVIVIGANSILLVLGGSEFESVASVLQLQAPVILTLFLVSALNPALIALHRQRQLAIITALSLLTAVVAGVILVPLMDAQGAALAAVLAELVNAGGAYLALRQAGPGRDISFGWLPRALLATGAGLAAGLACPGPDAVATVAAVAVFGAAVLALRLVPSELWALVRRDAA
jgi:O-antigen/teichoic acid export membrane protein